MDRFEFVALTEADLPLLAQWLAEPHVARWWPDPAEQLEDIRAAMAHPLVEPFRVDLEGRPFGYIQRYAAEADATWRDQPAGTWGLDTFIGGGEDIGRGLGTAMVQAFVARTFSDKAAAPRLITDPDPANRRAVRCYEKAGFHALHEVDTPWGRTLLMWIERRTRNEWTP